MTPPSVIREEAVKALAEALHVALHPDRAGSLGSGVCDCMTVAERQLQAIAFVPAARAALVAYLVPDRLAGFRVREGDPNAVYPAFDVTGAYREAAPDRLATLERALERLAALPPGYARRSYDADVVDEILRTASR